MVEAMGPLCCEGMFRKACEVTLRVLREHKDMLRTVLQAFIHDPLSEWLMKPKKEGNGGQGWRGKREKEITLKFRISYLRCR